ncbi:hypothetical protein HK101_003667, partial [Irineochytrium annulatum]
MHLHILAALTALCVLPATGASKPYLLDHRAVPNRYIVELHTSVGASMEQRSNDQAELRTRVLGGHPTVREVSGRHAYTRLLSGLLVHADSKDDLNNLAKDHSDLIRAVHQVRRIDPPSYRVDNIDMPDEHESAASDEAARQRLSRRDNAANNLTDINGLPVEDFAPAGVTVCLIDTGVDYTHPALGGCFGKPGCLVQYGSDLVGNAYDPDDVTNATANALNPSDDPMDCAGHGTHVAGIVAARDVEGRGAQGVAPNVTLGAYKVFGCEGGTDTAVILQAMEYAAEDGCNIINLSLGNGAGWFDSPDSILADMLSLYGMIVVAAAGNSQDFGLYRIGVPAVAKTVTAVGSIDNTRYIGREFTVANGTEQAAIAFAYPTGTEPNITSGYIKASASLNITDVQDGCDPYEADYFKGYIALIRRGTCLFTTKIENAYNASASAVIIYNRLPQILGEIDTPIPSFPTFTISGKDGDFLISLLKAQGNGAVSVTFNKSDVTFNVESAGRVSDFTSWGPSPDFDLKPEILAPGGQIFSTYPVKLGRYATLSGTSMASPYMSGLYALALAGLKGIQDGQDMIDPLALKSLFMSTASQALLFNGSDLTSNLTAPVFLQGAGVANVTAALLSDFLFDTPYLALGPTAWDAEGLAEKTTTTVNVTNMGNHARTLTFSFVETSLVGADDPYNPFIPTTAPAKGSEVTLTPANVHIPAGGSAEITVSITPPSRAAIAALNTNLTSWLYGGHILAAGADGVVHRIAIAGVAGNFTTISPLDLDVYPPFLSYNLTYNASMPEINATNADELDGLADDANVTMVFDFSDDTSMPMFNIHLNLPSPVTLVTVFPASVPSAQRVKSALDYTATVLQQMTEQSGLGYNDGSGGVDGEGGAGGDGTSYDGSVDEGDGSSVVGWLTSLLGSLFGGSASAAAPTLPKGAVAATGSPGVELPNCDPDSSEGALYLSFGWDGSKDFMGTGRVRDGNYVTVITVLSEYAVVGGATGVWESPMFTVKRSGYLSCGVEPTAGIGSRRGSVMNVLCAASSTVAAASKDGERRGSDGSGQVDASEENYEYDESDAEADADAVQVDRRLPARHHSGHDDAYDPLPTPIINPADDYPIDGHHEHLGDHGPSASRDRTSYIATTISAPSSNYETELVGHLAVAIGAVVSGASRSLTLKVDEEVDWSSGDVTASMCYLPGLPPEIARLLEVGLGEPEYDRDEEYDLGLDSGAPPPPVIEISDDEPGPPDAEMSDAAPPGGRSRSVGSASAPEDARRKRKSRNQLPAADASPSCTTAPSKKRRQLP